MVIVLALAGLASSLLQNAPRIVFERIKPEFSRISIGQGLETDISAAQGRVEFGEVDVQVRLRLALS